MARELSPEQQRELEYVHVRRILILDFLVEHSDQPFPSAEMIREVLEQTARAGNLPGTRSVRGDPLDMSRTLSAEEQRDLAELLKAQAGDDPFSTRSTA